MLRDPEAAVPFEFPSVDAPTPAERHRLDELRRELELGLRQCVARFAGEQFGWQVDPARLLSGDEGLPAERWAVQVTVRDSQADWRLLLSEAAAGSLVAAGLGLPDTSEGPRGAVDEAVMGVIGRDLGQRVRRAAAMGTETVIEVGPAFDAGPTDLEPPMVLFRVALVGASQAAVGASAPTAVLATSWPAQRAAAAAAPHTTQRLGVESLHEAAAPIEAVLRGAVVSARELLGLRPGDVIPLGPTAQEVVLRVHGRPVATGRAGARGQHLAVSLRRTDLAREDEHHAT